MCSMVKQDGAVAMYYALSSWRKRHLFSIEMAIIFVVDNYGHIVKLLHQYRGHVLTRLLETQDMAVNINSFEDTGYAPIKYEVQLFVDQDYISPMLMVIYKKDGK